MLDNNVKIHFYLKVKKCKPIKSKPMVILNCTSDSLELGTICYQTCPYGYNNVGSAYRICASIQKWSGLPGKCKGKKVMRLHLTLELLDIILFFITIKRAFKSNSFPKPDCCDYNHQKFCTI